MVDRGRVAAGGLGREKKDLAFFRIWRMLRRDWTLKDLLWDLRGRAVADELHGY